MSFDSSILLKVATKADFTHNDASNFDTKYIANLLLGL